MDAGIDIAARVHQGTYGELVRATEKEGEGTGRTHCFLTFTQSQVGGSASQRDDVAANRSVGGSPAALLGLVAVLETERGRRGDFRVQ